MAGERDGGACATETAAKDGAADAGAPFAVQRTIALRRAVVAVQDESIALPVGILEVEGAHVAGIGVWCV